MSISSTLAYENATTVKKPQVELKSDALLMLAGWPARGGARGDAQAAAGRRESNVNVAGLNKGLWACNPAPSSSSLARSPSPHALSPRPLAGAVSPVDRMAPLSPKPHAGAPSALANWLGSQGLHPEKAAVRCLHSAPRDPAAVPRCICSC